MTIFHFNYPLQVRYGDLDAQAHVNNAHFITFIEQARLAYLVETGLFDGENFLDLGLIVADVHMAYLAPLKLGQPVEIGVRVSRIGNKSLTLEYEVRDARTGSVAARAETIMVAYDYHTSASRPVSAEWRAKIEAFENPT